ncbi:hypothetical protein RJ035_006678 [Blastomyces gilchristii]
MITESLPDQSQTGLSVSEGEDMVSELLPGAAAMKVHLAGSRKRIKSTPALESSQKPKKAKLNVMEAARQRRKAVDEAAMQRREQEVASFRAMTESVDIGRLRNLAIVEEMVVPVMSREQIDPADSVRYDQRWNGRKNFKKFRRKGHGCSIPRTVQPVIVPLEEVKRKDFGLGGAYWSTSQPRARHHTTIGRNEETPSPSRRIITQSKSPTRPASIGKRPRDTRDARESDSEDCVRFRFRRRKGR